MASVARIVVGRDGRIALVNELAQRLLGFSERELIGRRSEELIVEAFRDAYVRARQAFTAEPRLDAGPMPPGTSALRTRSGHVVDVVLEAHPLLADDQLWVQLALRPQAA